MKRLKKRVLELEGEKEEERKRIKKREERENGGESKKNGKNNGKGKKRKEKRSNEIMRGMEVKEGKCRKAVEAILERRKAKIKVEQIKKNWQEKVKYK